jgi:hypothetical protein
MDTVASSALQARAGSTAVRSARCDSDKSFKAITNFIIKRLKETRHGLYRMRPLGQSLLHISVRNCAA